MPALKQERETARRNENPHAHKSVRSGLRNLSAWGTKRFRPHQRCCVTPSKGHPPGNLVFLADNFLEKLQRKTIAACSTAKECSMWQFLRFFHPWFSAIIWFFLRIFVFEKQLWTAERGDSQNYVRKLHPLYLLQLSVFITSFAVLIQGTIKKSRIRIGKGPLALLACDIKTCKLPNPHQKIFSWTGWFLIFFFPILPCICPC